MPANNASQLIHTWAQRQPGLLGHLWSPGRAISYYPWLPYVLDNGKYAATVAGREWSGAQFLAHCEDAMKLPKPPAWIVVPDAIRNAAQTLKLWRFWEPRLRPFNVPLAFVLQDGLEIADIPESAEVWFVGGSDDWRYPRLAQIVEQAHARQRLLHVGRVNGLKVWVCHRLGVDSCDGTGWLRGPDQRAKLDHYLRYRVGEAEPPQSGQLNLFTGAMEQDLYSKVEPAPDTAVLPTNQDMMLAEGQWGNPSTVILFKPVRGFQQMINGQLKVGALFYEHFEGGLVPLTSLMPITPMQNGPLCYLVDATRLTASQLHSLAKEVADRHPSEFVAMDRAIGYVQDGLPLRCDHFSSLHKEGQSEPLIDFYTVEQALNLAPPLQIELRGDQAYVIAGLIALALAHPALRSKDSASAAIARDVAEQIRQKVGMLGFDPHLLSQSEPIEISMIARDAYALVGVIQLSLRHPELRTADGSSALAIGRIFAEKMQAALSLCSPAVARSLGLGWDESWDLSDTEFQWFTQTGTRL